LKKGDQGNKKFLLLAFALLVTSSAKAQTPATDDLNRRIIENRAIGAVIWGIPAVNYDLMLQEMLTKTDGKVGQAIYWGRSLDSKNQTLTPNPDALYFMVFFDTKNGPVVFDLPPGDANGSFNGNIVTVWQMPLEDAGLLGLDKRKGGKFLVLPPAMPAKSPTAISRCSQTLTSATCCFARNFKSHSDADVQASIAYGKRLTDPARKFELMARFYAPRSEFFEKKWVLPDVEKSGATIGSGAKWHIPSFLMHPCREGSWLPSASYRSWSCRSGPTS